jgi:hypothetical protein
MTYACLTWELAAGTSILAPTKQGFPDHWHFLKAHNGPNLHLAFKIQYVYDVM